MRKALLTICEHKRDRFLFLCVELLTAPVNVKYVNIMFVFY